MFTDLANDKFASGVEIYDCFHYKQYKQLEFNSGYVLILKEFHPALNSLVGRIVKDSKGQVAIVHKAVNGGNCVILNIDKKLNNNGRAFL